MSQQELVPEPQDQDSGSLAKHFKAPRSSGKNPKEEHPATFAEAIPPYSYPAQDRVTYTGEKVRQQSRARRQRPVDDGDAFEMGYRPYRYARQQQVPPWARPQQHNRAHVLRWLIAVGLIVLLIKIMPLLLLGLLGLMGILALVIALPIIILSGLLILVLAIVVISVRSALHGHRMHHRLWGGPWI